MIDTSKLSFKEKVELLTTLEQHDYIVSGNKMKTMYSTPDIRKAYSKQLDFFKLGKSYSQRLFMAGNRTGKTVSGAFEMTCHLTGIYPDWWEGIKFTEPVNCCAAGTNSKTVRDILQKELFGNFSELGTGMIPRDLIKKPHKAQGLADAIEFVDIAHSSGGTSVLYFKSYEQGRKSFEGTIYNVVWCDEEMPNDIYTEILTRTATVEGILITTFTPLEGPTELVTSFMDAKPESGKIFISQTWDDVPHLTAKVKEQLLASYPVYQRDARSKGVPMLGAGAIYPVNEEQIVINPIEIPKHWKKIYGLDVGWNNTAAAWLAIDLDSDTYYVYSDYKAGHSEPYIHAEAIKARGSWIPGVIDPASAGSNQVDGRKVRDMFTQSGLDLENANNSVEAGIYEVWTRLSTGRLKIFNNCQSLLSELRIYRRDNKGKIIKSNDHILDALRYAVMSAGSRAKAYVDPNSIISIDYSVSRHTRVTL